MPLMILGLLVIAVICVGSAVSASDSGKTIHTPMFECPDKSMETIFAFRWKVYQSHIKQTPEGQVVTEFSPDVAWGGKYNTIPCALGHHIYEGRWLNDRSVMDDYIRFWLNNGDAARKYSTWLADAIWQRSLVTGDFSQAISSLDKLIANYHGWESTNLHPCGLFWSHDGADGMEVSISGDGFRPTLNSYMFADALAISRIAKKAGRSDIAAEFEKKAVNLKRLVLERLWDPKAKFFKVFPYSKGFNITYAATLPHELMEKNPISWSFSKIPSDFNVREEVGFVPWAFHLPDSGCEQAWTELNDPDGFLARFGPTTAERRHPRYRYKHQHECQWNGPSWPFATSQTLTSLAVLLHEYKQSVMTRKDYFKLLETYTNSQWLTTDDGRRVPWIDEDLDPDTGEWLARKLMYESNRPDKDRGADYNHSSYCDLIISGLVGLKPRSDDLVEVDPLLPAGVWEWFKLSDIPYHGHELTIIYDKSGQQFGQGKGLSVLEGEQVIANRQTLGRVKGRLK